MKRLTKAQKHLISVIVGVIIISAAFHNAIPEPGPDLPEMPKDYPDVNPENLLEVKFIATAQDLLNTGHALNQFRYERDLRPIVGRNQAFCKS